MKSHHHFEKRVQNLSAEITRRANAENQVERSMLPALQSRWFNSHDVKTAFIAREHRGHVDWELVTKQVARFDPYEGPSSPISCYMLPRKGRYPRIVCKLPMLLRAAHNMASHIVNAQFEPHRALYHWKGRGKERLAASLRSILRSGRRPYLVMADVKDCFPSINIDAIFNLRVLPDAFVAAALDTQRMSFRKKDRPHHGGDHNEQGAMGHPIIRARELAGLSGLLQGSPVSGPLLAMLLNDLPGRLPLGVQPYIYADNILVACAALDVARRVEDILACYFNRHPAGPLSLTIQEIIEPRCPFSFAGYTFEYIDQVWRARPSNKNLVRAIQRFLQSEEAGESDPNEQITELMNSFPIMDEASLISVVRFLSEA